MAPTTENLQKLENLQKQENNHHVNILLVIDLQVLLIEKLITYLNIL